ncbi:hypothetical protein BC834DRAFT_852915, partial [Gloeopeniophorella convolvens]
MDASGHPAAHQPTTRFVFAEAILIVSVSNNIDSSLSWFRSAEAHDERTNAHGHENGASAPGARPPSAAENSPPPPCALLFILRLFPTQSTSASLSDAEADVEDGEPKKRSAGPLGWPLFRPKGPPKKPVDTAPRRPKPKPKPEPKSKPSGGCVI